MLDAVVDFLPSPLDLPPTQGHKPNHPEDIEERKADDSDAFSALAFKIMTDPFVGKLTYLRGLLGHAHQGRVHLQLDQGQKRADRSAPPDARQRPGAQRRHLRRRHRGGGRSQQHLDR